MVINKNDVKKIKQSIVSGKDITELSNKYSVSYMTIYKIATGKTWKQINPKGRLIGDRDYNKKRIFSDKKCEILVLKKLKGKLTNKQISDKLNVTESTVRRAIQKGREILIIRFQKLNMNGKRNKIKRKFGLSDEDIDNIIKSSIGDIGK